MSEPLDITNSKYTTRAKDNKNTAKIFNDIDKVISFVKSKKITLKHKDYQEIINHFTPDIQKRIIDSFMYRDALITWL